MGSVVYLIRPSEESIARSVCFKEGTGVVLTLDNVVPETPIQSIAEKAYLHRTEKLSYEQMLEVLLEADKVITL